jgi:hypothetical protein
MSPLYKNEEASKNFTYLPSTMRNVISAYIPAKNQYILIHDTSKLQLFRSAINFNMWQFENYKYEYDKLYQTISMIQYLHQRIKINQILNEITAMHQEAFKTSMI